MNNGGNKPRVRCFDWRDLLLVQRLQGQGQALDFEASRVDGIYPLRDAFHAYLLPRTGSRRTLVSPETNAFAQYNWPKGSNHVRLTYLAPAPTSTDDAERWVGFLEQLVAALGTQGLHHVVAEASDDGPAMELLQRAGFGTFTRQTLFCLASANFSDDLPALPGLRPWQSRDDWGLRLLHTNTVPRLAQQIEAPVDNAFTSSRWHHRLVLERDQEIIAALATRRGRVGSTLRLLLHPEADEYVEAIIRNGLAKLDSGPTQPIYCRVRRYESWLQAPLEASGFRFIASTALLVKHIVARVMTPEWHRTSVVEGRAEMTTPVARARFQKSLKS